MNVDLKGSITTENGIGSARRSLTEFLRTGEGVTEITTPALAQVTGAKGELLEEFAKKGNFLELVRLRPGVWLASILGAIPDAPTRRQKYLKFVTDASAEGQEEQKPDLLSELTIPAKFMFDQLPLSVQEELRGLGLDPAAIPKHVSFQT